MIHDTDPAVVQVSVCETQGSVGSVPPSLMPLAGP